MLALVSACGGGGGGGGVISAPAPAPTPAPTPAPSPAPTPVITTVNTNTQEYRRSDGPAFHGAVTAWNNGATGQGETIAIFDTGIDLDSPEFAGRLSSASANVVGANITVNAEDDHGTNVALVAAAGLNNTGVVGIAFGATILALRGDEPGSCASGVDSTDPLDGCSFTDTAIAAGIDRAVSAGATVINLSLGGSMPNANVRRAVRNAAAAGVVIVVAAGNDGDSTEDGINPNQPDPFGAGLLEAGGTNVIIAGSVDNNGNLSAFSNRAGDLSASYLSALGEGICCTYKDGELLIETNPDGSRFVYVFSGTSFAAPQISGAVALLAQAFPNLTGAQIVEILLNSARDAGAAGADALYGRGILDISAAFRPSGTTALAGGTMALALADNTGATSGPMGDAVANVLIGTLVQDKYGRAFEYDFGRNLRTATARQPLAPALGIQGRRDASVNETASLAFNFSQGSRAGGLDWEPSLRLSQDDAEKARILAARAAFKIAPDLQLGFAFRQGADGLVAQLQGQDRPAFMIAASATGDEGFLRGTDMTLAVRRQIGKYGLTVNVENGQTYSANVMRQAGLAGQDQVSNDASSFGASIDRDWGAFDASVGVNVLSEARTVLGASFHDALGAGGAQTAFLDANAGFDIGHGLRLGAALRQGYSRARTGGVITSGSEFVSRSWSFDLERRGVFGRTDSLGFRLSQPLRVVGGGLNLELPVGYDYATEKAAYGISRLSLAPEGRELMGEIAWRGKVLGGFGAASLFYRKEPGHFAGAPDDKGVALRWSSGF
ncbi:S8 family peptidase [Altererythrobacter aquiaggeris]|uniref:S8 family peptidase n=1 Tax=Aestuarierythrobacter aquiaggeris TaxID=1898396 RepID=UPI003017AD9C